MAKYNDFPLDECMEAANALVAEGAKVHQKFTCAGCGARLTIDEPNTFYEIGTCDKCNVVTNIRQRGCNYMVIRSFK